MSIFYRVLKNRAHSILRRLRCNLFPNTMDKLLAIHGWTQEQQLRYLMQAVQALPDNSLIVEVGVWKGRSVLAMATACRGTKKRIFAIDPWEDYEQQGHKVSALLHQWNVASFEDNFAAFKHNCRKLKLEYWVVPMRKLSLEAAREWSDGPPAMVFIDGNHDYDAVSADLTAWSALIQPGGIICGDDWSWPSVQAAVKDFITQRPELRLELPCVNTWAFIKAK